MALVAAGFLGTLLGRTISAKKAGPNKTQKKSNPLKNIYLKPVLALVGSGLIAYFCIGLLAQDIRIFDSKLGSVVAQPAVGQIVFAVLVSFGIAGFVVKKFLNAGYIWPIISSAFITLFAVSTYVKHDILQHLIQYWPAVFFPNAAAAVLPVQMAAFGTLGSIWGYWLAVRYDYWRKHEL